MASSGIQIFGFLLALFGLSATIAATFMVEWKKESEGKYKIYEGLWMTCGGSERSTCEFHKSIFKVSVEIQATRSLMLLSIFLSAVGLLVSTLGMKCTRFLDEKKKTKAFTAITGGIILILAGLVSLAITSWYVSQLVYSYKMSHRLHSFEFGKAVFVSWAGGLLNVLGGMFVSYRRCCRRSEALTSNHLLPTSHSKSNYV